MSIFFQNVMAHIVTKDNLFYDSYLFKPFRFVFCALYFSPVHDTPEPEPFQQRKQQLPSVSQPPAELGNVSRPQSVQNGEILQPDPIRQLLQDELFRLVQVCDKYQVFNICLFVIHKIFIVFPF